MGNKRKNNVTFKDRQRYNVCKAKPPPAFSCWCRNSNPRKPLGGVKSAGGGDCE